MREALMKFKLPRNDWAGVVYVGEIGMTFGQCITEHHKAFKCNYSQRSAIAKHGLKACHVPLWDSVCILDAILNKSRSRILETQHSEETQ